MTSQPTMTKAGNGPEGPGGPGGSPGEPDGGLHAGLKNRHLSMIAIGGVTPARARELHAAGAYGVAAIAALWDAAHPAAAALELLAPWLEEA